MLKFLAPVFLAALVVALLIRAMNAPRRAAGRYLRAAVGILALCIGIFFVMKKPHIGLALIAFGVILIYTATRR